MLNVSSAFKTQLDNDKRNFLYRLTFTLQDNSTLVVENDGLWSGSVKFTQATSGTGSFDVGAFIIGKLNFILNNMYGTFDNYDFTLATVDYEIGLKLANNNTEYLRRGRYVVDEVDYDGYLISFECLDYAYYFEQPWATTLLFPTTAGAIIQEACTKCGITLATSSWDGYNISVDVKPTDKNLTWLAAIGYAAQMCGQYAIMDNLGRLAVKWYDIDNLSQVTLDGSILDSTDARILDHIDDPIIGSMVGAAAMAWEALPSAKKSLYARINDNSRPPKVSHYPILITGVKCVIGSGDNEVEYTTGTTEYMVDVSGNPFITSANVSTVINRIAENMVGFYFYSFDVSYISRPYYEAGDLAWIEDYRNGRVYCSFITNLNFTSGQYQESSCGAETPAKKRTASYTPAMKILAEAGRATRASLDTYEAVAKSMTELISLGYGMHFSKEVQSDGSAIYYLHDGATLNESSSVWKLTSNGLVVSHDHGTTWAIDTNGNALFNVITARGLNADWINAGKIEIKDTGGNTIFLADITNKVVSIGGLDRAISLADMALNAVEDKLSIVLSDDYKTIVTASDGSISTFPTCKTFYKVYFNGSDITENNDVAYQLFLMRGVQYRYDYDPNYFMEITGLPDLDYGWVCIRATYKGLKAEKRFYVYKRKVGGSTNYGLDVDSTKSVIGQGIEYSPNLFTANAYSTTNNGSTKTAYSGGNISVDVQLDNGAWNEDVATDEGGTWVEEVITSSASSSLTVKVVRTNGVSVEVDTSGTYDTIKVPVSALRVRFNLKDTNDVLLDRQDVTLLTASDEDLVLNSAESQEKIYNALTNNGEAQGIYLENGRLYLNASYIGSGAIQIGTWSNDEVPVFTETFYANSADGTVRINANSLKIQGTNVVDAAATQAALDAEDSILNSVDSQDKIFDALIGGDNQQGIILDNGKLYLSSTYIRTGTLKVGGVNNTNGTIEMRNASNTVIGGINNTEIFHKHTNNDKVSMNSGGLYFYRNTSTEVGSIKKYVSGNKYYLQVYGQDSVDITSKGTVEIRTEDSSNVYPGITVKKSSTAPVEIHNGANEYWVEIPTSINTDGTVASFASVRLVGGIIYNR